MKRYFLYTFLLIFVLGFLVWPAIGLANEEKEIQLNNDDANFLLNTVQKKLYQRALLSLSEPDFKLEDGAAMTVIHKAVKNKMFSYFFQDVPKEVTKDFIKVVLKIIRLIYSQDIASILEEIEKESVEKAKEYLLNFLLQNEIKVKKGHLEYSYTSYKGNIQKAFFQYIITFQSLDNKLGLVAMEFYSQKTIEPPPPSYNTPCILEEDLTPFILRIKGKVENFHGAYIFVGEPEIEVVFDEPVPDLGFKEPNFFDKLKARLNEIEIVFEKIVDIFFGGKEQVAERLKATIAPEFPQPEIEEIKEKLEKIEEVVQEGEAAQEGMGGPVPELSLAEIQEMLDDISERIEIISQQVANLIGEQPELEPGPGAAPEPEGIGQGEVGQVVKEEEKQAEEKPGERRSSGVGSVILPSYCQKSGEGQASRDKIIINEISWMGTSNSSNNEWIELKNISNEPVNLAGWQVLDKEQQIKIIFKEGNFVPAQGFYLLERTDDNSVPGISADLIYTGALNDTNEALYLFDENCQVQDEVIAEPDWPAGNKEERRTMERSSDLNWQTYFGLGQEGIMGTPKAENSLAAEAPQSGAEAGQPFEEQEEETPQDTTPPEVIFELEPIQTSLSFSLTWTGTDPMDSVSPSGIDGFLLRFSEDQENWNYLPSENQHIQGTSYDFIGEDEKTYYFQVKVKDVAGNESDWLPESPANTTIKLPKKILINEVQIDSLPGSGGTDDDWVELYNPQDFDVSLAGWSIQEHSSDDPCSIDKSFYKKNFPEEAVIPANGFFLIVDTEAGDCLKNIADLTIGWSLTKGNTIYLVRGQDIVDKLGFGTACFPEGNAAENPPEGQCLERKELGLDTNDNSQDFEIKKIPSPTNSLGQTVSLPCLASFGQAAWPMFLHDSQATNRSPFSGPGISEEPKLETLIKIEGEGIGSSVIGSDGTIYLPTSQGLFAFYYNGTQKWIYELNSIFGMPALWEPTETIYIFSRDQGILAIDIKDGSLRWKKEFNILEISQGPIIGDEGKIYFITEDSGLIVLDENGEQSWFYDFGPISGPVSNLVVNKEGSAYFGHGNTLFAVNAGGKKWERTFETKCKTFVCSPRISNLLIADDGTIYVMVVDEEDFSGLTDADRLNCLHALNPENPEPEEEKWPALCWRFSLIPIPISFQGNIYTSVSWLNISANFMTRIVAYDSQGQSLANWQSPSLPEVGRPVSLIVDKEETIYVLFGYYDNTVRALNLNGEEKWSLKLEKRTGPIYPLVLGGDGTLFVPTQKKLFVVKP